MAPAPRGVPPAARRLVPGHRPRARPRPRPRLGRRRRRRRRGPRARGAGGPRRAPPGLPARRGRPDRRRAVPQSRPAGRGRHLVPQHDRGLPHDPRGRASDPDRALPRQRRPAPHRGGAPEQHLHPAAGHLRVPRAGVGDPALPARPVRRRRPRHRQPPAGAEPGRHRPLAAPALRRGRRPPGRLRHPAVRPRRPHDHQRVHRGHGSGRPPRVGRPPRRVPAPALVPPALGPDLRGPIHRRRPGPVRPVRLGDRLRGRDRAPAPPPAGPPRRRDGRPAPGPAAGAGQPTTTPSSW